MKLYTEEQVKDMLNRVMMLEHHVVEFLNKYYTPIQLPSDEEIFQKSIEIMEEWYGSGCKTEIDAHFRGAKWMRDKILNN